MNMEITRLKWDDNHPILSGLDLNLTDSHGNPYKTIIIAGDNGIGKTTILQSILDIMTGESGDFEAFEYNIGADKYVASGVDGSHIKVKKEGGDFENVQLSHARRNHFDFGEIGSMDDYAPQKFSAVMSAASTDFNSSVENKDDYNAVKQHLITLERQDNEAYKAKNMEQEANGQQPIPISSFNRTDSKLERFKRTFNEMFEDLKFLCVKSGVEDTRVIFTKNSNEEIDIDKLSTGEKQIVFRGSAILTQAKESDVVLIDEPELSMHPRWMEKVLKFYKGLATGTNTQKSQLFITTHSDVIIRKAVEEGNALIIRLTKDGTHVVSNKPDDLVLSSPTSAEINYAVFRIYSIDYHIQLFAQLHNEIIANDNTKVAITKADISIKGQPQCTAHYLKRYENISRGRRIVYETLPCYVRNCIDHPDSPNFSGTIQRYTPQELRDSTELLRKLIVEQKKGNYDFNQ